MIKYITVSVEHPSITMLRIEVNGKIIKSKTFNSISYFRVVDQDKVDIFFEPWKIFTLTPLINFGFKRFHCHCNEFNPMQTNLAFKRSVKISVKIVKYFKYKILIVVIKKHGSVVVLPGFVQLITMCQIQPEHSRSDLNEIEPLFGLSFCGCGGCGWYAS